MAGKGDLVSYEHATAKTKEEREQLKQKIIRMLDNTTKAVTIIALVGETEPPGDK
jgi:hypothetical protein